MSLTMEREGKGMGFFENVTFGCWWDLPLLAVMAAATAWYLIERRRLKKEKEKLQNRS